MDSNLIISLLFIAIVLVVAFVLKNAIPESFPFVKKECLLNQAERVFYEKLLVILPQDKVIFPQVVLSNIIKCNTSKDKFWKYQNKINKKTVDFVIFDKKNLQPILVIEYDGSTHDRPDRIKRDDFVAGALVAAGIKLVRVKHKDPNSVSKVTEALALQTDHGQTI